MIKGLLCGLALVISLVFLIFFITCLFVIYYQGGRMTVGDWSGLASAFAATFTLVTAIVALTLSYRANKIAVKASSRSDIVSAAALVHGLISQNEKKFPLLNEFKSGIYGLDAKFYEEMQEDAFRYTLQHDGVNNFQIKMRMAGYMEAALSNEGYYDFVMAMVNLVEFSKSISDIGHREFAMLIIVGIPWDWIYELNSMSIFMSVICQKVPLWNDSLGASNLPYVQARRGHGDRWRHMYGQLKMVSDFLSQNCPEEGPLVISPIPSLEDLGWISGR